MLRVMSMPFCDLGAPFEAPLPTLEGATGWLNTEPMTVDDLLGKVVLVDFWTYTCINWIRTLPYTRSWAEVYRRHGLVVVGVHSPEFTIEHDVERVRTAVRERRIEYPIAIDNDHAVWDAFDNRYWPSLYIADRQGSIRHQYFGEGGHEESEHVIRHLLADGAEDDLPVGPEPVYPHGIEAPADWDNVRSAETYLGLARSEGFASPGGGLFEDARVYSVPERLLTNQWGLDGTWTFRAEDVLLNEANGRITYRFHARDLHLILAPPSDDSAARFCVRLDGRPPHDAHGLDVDHDGNGIVTEPRLYQLIRQSGPITDRVFEIDIVDPGASALCFTFG